MNIVHPSVVFYFSEHAKAMRPTIAEIYNFDMWCIEKGD
jgi:hypothetical protein